MAGQALRAEALAARLPPLLVAAERVAATVAQGLHGRRRAGQGSTFWQYRPFQAGDMAARIDWRQTGRSGRVTVRDAEWEAAQTVILWRDPGPGMRWQSRPDLPEKRDRADLLLLALASLLLRGGEKVRLAGLSRSFQGQSALGQIADALMQTAAPWPDPPPRHAQMVLFSDFLSPLPDLQARLATLAMPGLHGHLIQVLDPAEQNLPFTGRVRFTAPAEAKNILIPNVDALRTRYQAALLAHQRELAAIGRTLRLSLTTHHTNHMPAPLLLALHRQLEGRNCAVPA
jgi:uncharacterized protein (DUF58 family)